MSTVLCVHYLKDGSITSEEQELWAMYHFSDRLDRLCAKIGTRPISEFCETTEAEADVAIRTEETVGTLDSYLRAASRGQWFPPEEGLVTIDRLLDALRKSPMRFGLLKDHYVEIMVDLVACRQSLDKARQQKAKFRLCLAE
jgi:hypothetical protein